MKIIGKITAFALAAVLSGGFFSATLNHTLTEPVSVSVAVYDEVPDGYTGIYTIDDLYAVRNNLSGKYILMNDIDLSATAPGGDWDSGNGWIPIDNFTGTFDGNGYAVKNMNIYGEINSSNEINLGLFGKCGNSAKILRLAVVDCNIDCHISKSDTSTTYIGAIAGQIYYINSKIYSPVIKSCYTSGNIKITTEESNYYIGGICGAIRGIITEHSTITDSFNTADIEVNIMTNTDEEVYGIFGGGIVGYGFMINNVYNAGNITVNLEGEDETYGGTGNIGGYLDMCYEKGNIGYYLKTLNNFDSYGYAYSGSSYNSSTAALTEAQMKSKAAFVGFDFDNVWTIDPTAEYPYPTLREVPYVASGSSENSGNSGNTVNTDSPLMGDVNGDGLVDVVDASCILQYYVYASTNGTMSPNEYFSSLN